MSNIYQRTWQLSLVPLCKEQSHRRPTPCTDFIPSLTNNGMCFTKNSAPTKEIYKQTRYIKAFSEVFLKGRDEFNVSNNDGSGKGFKYSFVVDAQRVMDLRNGLNWNQTKPATFSIALHQAYDMPDIRDDSFDVSAGFRTIVRVNAFQLQSSDEVESMDLTKRNCKFDDEIDIRSPFKRYSR